MRVIAKHRVAGRAFVAAVAVCVSVAVAQPAHATPTVSPVVYRTSSGVTADALPTVQIDGVVWSQAIVGNTVYAGGDFANARPAGAAPGTDLTPRSDLLAYNLTTGTLITTFDPVLDGTVKTVVASPDGTRLYVGGSFTTVNGQHRYRIAAFDTATGKLITSFAPTLDATVNALTVTNSTVYAGGIFGTVNGNARTRLAAFSAANGALLAWSPTADYSVDALLLTPDGTHVIVGGGFDTINGASALGLASLDARTGAMVPFAVNQVVKNYGSGSAILSLSTDGTAIYGTGYDYSGGKFEGTFSANPSTGAINWLEDCHGDTYGSYAHAGQVYVVSHEHYCGNVGGFPETSPRTWHRTTAFTTDATGTLTANGSGSYASYTGQPSPSLINWFPDLTAGTYTNQNQAAWSVTGAGNYVVEGGEFPDVNGTAQQGLVRFAVQSVAPNKRGPMDTAAGTSTPTATAESETSASVSWPANWDQDNDTLSYRLLRNGSTVYTTSAVSQFWNRPTLTYDDTGLAPGTTYKYTVVSSDPAGNTAGTAPATITTPGTPPAATTTAVSPSTTTPVAGQSISADISVSTDDSTAADGSVDVTIDGGAAQQLALQGGHAQLSTSFAAPGTHTMAVSYAGNTVYATSSSTTTFTVAKNSSVTSASISPTALVTGQRLTVRSTIGTVAPGTAAATGTITVAVDGKVVRSSVLSSAAATTPLPGLQAGRHTVTVRYSGDSVHATSTTSRTITVTAGSTAAQVTSSAPHAHANRLVRLRAQVRALSPATGQPAGTVIYYVDGHRRATRTLHSGVATWSVRLPKGRHRVQIRYVASSAFHASTSKTVKQIER